MIDGNTASLNQYQRHQDALADGEQHLEFMQQALSDDLFDAYVTKNYAVIDEINDALYGEDTVVDQMREAMTKECERPVMGRGCEMYSAYLKIISEECDKLAKRCKTPDEFDRFRREFGL